MPQHHARWIFRRGFEAVADRRRWANSVQSSRYQSDSGSECGSDERSGGLMQVGWRPGATRTCLCKFCPRQLGTSLGMARRRRHWQVRAAAATAANSFHRHWAGGHGGQPPAPPLAASYGPGNGPAPARASRLPPTLPLGRQSQAGSASRLGRRARGRSHFSTAPWQVAPALPVRLEPARGLLGRAAHARFARLLHCSIRQCH